jgi:hypothetical protein
VQDEGIRLLHRSLAWDESIPILHCELVWDVANHYQQHKEEQQKDSPYQYLVLALDVPEVDHIHLGDHHRNGYVADAPFVLLPY